MHLGHINERLTSDLHKYVDGVLALPCSDILHSCPVCAQAKLHKVNCGNTNTTEATDCWQDIQINVGFLSNSCQDNKTKETTVETMQGVTQITIGTITSQSQVNNLCPAAKVIHTSNTRER